MGCCLSSSAAPDAVDEEAPATKKQARRVQKERLHSGLSSDDHAFDESFKGKTKRGRQLVRRFSGSGDAEGEEAAERPDLLGSPIPTPLLVGLPPPGSLCGKITLS